MRQMARCAKIWRSLFLSLLIAGKCRGVPEVQFSGPGLDADKNPLPTQYFFIQISPGPEEWSDLKRYSFRFTPQQTLGGNCQARTDLLQLEKNLLVARYRLRRPCKHGFSLSVRFDGVDLPGSPLSISGFVPSEDCYCPHSWKSWLARMQCPKTYAQIDSDLQSFEKVNMTLVGKQFEQVFTNPGAQSVCRYAVKDNEIYRKCYGEHVGFMMFVDQILTSMTRKARLPDIEFFANLGDWPLIKKDGRGKKPRMPLFSWCGSVDTWDIVWPTYDITEATLQMLNRVTLDVFSAAASATMPWSSRNDIAFWRGRDSNRERLDLVRFSRKRPDIVEAGLTRMFFFRDQMQEFEPLAEQIPFFDFFKYKYLVNVDGTVAAYRMPYLLAGGSLVLKQDSPYYEHFYSQLEVGKHFWPLRRDLSDLATTVESARRNSAAAEVVGINARKFVLENLHPREIFCYHAILFEKWSQRLVEPVVIQDGMEKVDQPVGSDACGCDVEKSSPKDEL